MFLVHMLSNPNTSSESNQFVPSVALGVWNFLAFFSTEDDLKNRPPGLEGVCLTGMVLLTGGAFKKI